MGTPVLVRVGEGIRREGVGGRYPCPGNGREGMIWTHSNIF